MKSFFASIILIIFSIVDMVAAPGPSYLIKIKVVLKNGNSFSASFIESSENLEEIKGEKITDKRVQLILNNIANRNSFNADKAVQGKVKLYKNIYYPKIQNIRVINKIINSTTAEKVEIGGSNSIPLFAFTSTNDYVLINPNEIKYCIFINITKETKFDALETKILVLDSVNCLLLRTKQIKTVCSSYQPENFLSAYFFFSPTLNKIEMTSEIQKYKEFYTSYNSSNRKEIQHWSQKINQTIKKLTEKEIFVFQIDYYD